MKSKPFVMRRLKPSDAARCTSLSPRADGRPGADGVGLQVQERQAARSCAAGDDAVLMRGRMFRSRPSARTKSAVNTVLGASWCDQPSDVCRVYGICSRGSVHCPNSGSAFGFAWFWLAMFDQRLADLVEACRPGCGCPSGCRPTAPRRSPCRWRRWPRTARSSWCRPCPCRCPSRRGSRPCRRRAGRRRSRGAAASCWCRSCGSTGRSSPGP